MGPALATHVLPARDADRQAPPIRRAATAGVIGTTIEFYDFSVYGLLAVVFAPLFFPSASPVASTLAALAVFGVGYLTRPLGGVVFGWLGDRVGRRTALMATILVMGTASVLIGLLPTYATIGVAAPALLVLLRLLQGLSAGGEVIGSQVYVVESAPADQRGRYGSLTPAGTGAGFALAAIVVATMSTVLTPAQLTAWGWRVPFLLCLPFTLLVLWLRLRLEDSPEFTAMVAKSQLVRTPLRVVLRSHRGLVLRIAGLTIGGLAPAYVGQLYLTVYLIQERGFAGREVYWMVAVVLLITSALYPLFGSLSDRVGRRPLVLTGLIGYAVLAFPLLWTAQAASSPWAVAPVLLLFLAMAPVASGAAFTAYAELFPGRVRFTGAALGFNLGSVVASGFGPYVSTQLVVATGSPLAPGWWAAGAALLGITLAVGLRDTHRGGLAR